MMKVVIYGAHGEKVQASELNAQRKHEFSISEFPVGVYFVKVVSGEDAQTLKLIKSN